MSDTHNRTLAERQARLNEAADDTQPNHLLTSNSEGLLLRGVYGRTAGSAPAFPHFAALTNAHIAWTGQSLDKWLADSDAFFPGNNMDFFVEKPQERKDLTAYFKQSAGK